MRSYGELDKKNAFNRIQVRVQSDTMALKVFDGYGAASRPEATLRVSGYLFLPKGILKRGGRESATHCELMFDDANDDLGVRLLDKEIDDVSAETVRPLVPEKSGCSIGVMPLLRYFAFPPKPTKKKRTLPVSFQTNNVIVMNLRDLRIEGVAS